MMFHREPVRTVQLKKTLGLHWGEKRERREREKDGQRVPLLRNQCRDNTLFLPDKTWF